jgi:hypothetical protein
VRRLLVDALVDQEHRHLHHATKIAVIRQEASALAWRAVASWIASGDRSR